MLLISRRPPSLASSSTLPLASCRFLVWQVVLGSVQNASEAVAWLGYTYLYVRMIRSPSLYGASEAERESDTLLEQRRIDLVHTAATLLDKTQLLRYERKSGQLQPTDLGRIAAYYYVPHQTVSVYNEYLKPTLSDIELLRLFAMSSDFANLAVREVDQEDQNLLSRNLPPRPATRDATHPPPSPNATGIHGYMVYAYAYMRMCVMCIVYACTRKVVSSYTLVTTRLHPLGARGGEARARSSH